MKQFLTTHNVVLGNFNLKLTLLDIDVDQLLIVLKTIFSWVVLMPIAVIISGVLLSKPFRLQVEAEQQFRLPIPTIFKLQATGGEVILGFAGFIITLLPVSLIGGQAMYAFFRLQFGIDPGQFNSLCILSSFITVAWSVVLWLIHRARTSIPDPVSMKRDEQIIEVSKQASKDKA
jgi:hypothetical protein